MHEDALRLLRIALGRRLTDQGWRKVDRAVRMMARSAELEPGLALLELAQRKRVVTRISEQPVDPVDPTTPVPEAVRERINELIHRLDAGLEPDAEPPDGQV
ncbi:CATRA system-associated protein [Streptomyces sp. MBT62]|uniref:CATRA system-associated protein n=1 Tax=Streptomyces sp. MBT62 TaxID=2800410 RepID=UPI00190B1A38|nr:CATRA system-associated protein [Streptomyces sp. MBT62]MBK3568172.1 hypothetical protein [Streptomyces sp. MBT62]